MNEKISVKIIGRFYDPKDANIKFVIQLETADNIWRGNSLHLILAHRSHQQFYTLYTSLKEYIILLYCRKCTLFVHLHYHSSKEVCSYNHKQLSKLQKKLTKFLDCLMYRLDTLNSPIVQDFLSLDISGNLTVNTIEEVIDLSKGSHKRYLVTKL